jgi:N-acetylmuramoyl-L-alanine amidase
VRLLLILGIFLCGTARAESGAGKLIIAIDPGHGGVESAGRMEDRTFSSANNARTPSGILEKTLTLELSKQIASALKVLAKETQRTVEVRLTRESDENPDFAERVRRCVGGGEPPAAIVSIHFNATDAHQAKGSLGMVAAADRNPNFERDRDFANRLARAAARGIAAFVPGSVSRGAITDSHLHAGKGSNFFYQLNKFPELRSVPACFLEVEFIDRIDIEEELIRRRSTTFPVIAREIAKELLER